MRALHVLRALILWLSLLRGLEVSTISLLLRIDLDGPFEILHRPLDIMLPHGKLPELVVGVGRGRIQIDRRLETRACSIPIPGALIDEAEQVVVEPLGWRQ